MALRSINPYTGELIREYPEMSIAEVAKCIENAHQVFRQWRTTDFSTRAKLLKNAALILRQRREVFARLMTEEMGKPITGARAEVEKCAWVCDYYADNAERFLAREPVATDASESYITYQPLGVILAIMPWNFPFWQVFRFAAPALMAGNAGVLKHASNVMGCADAIEGIFREAGFPEGLFAALRIGSASVEKVIEHPLVRAVSLTGSTAAGKAVAAKAGSLVKKTVLELGGSDAYVVLEDANLSETVTMCVTGRLINSGQSCIAAKRFVVVESVQKEFGELMIAKMAAAKMGNPMEEDTVIGPLARHDLRDELHAQVQRSIQKGAVCRLGGKIPDGKGAFYPATVLTNVRKGMPAFDEELFGPVAAIIGARDEEDAIAIANDSLYGLGAAVFTRDLEKGKRIAERELEAGNCFVNAFVKSDPRLPFGGIKESGYGRELSLAGIREFVNIKTVYVK